MDKLKEYLIYPLIILGIIASLYNSSLSNKFSGLDDFLIIEENWDQLSDLQYVYKAFSEDIFLGQENFYYRPILTLSYMPDVFITNSTTPEPSIFFIGNLLLFTLIGIFLFWYLKEFNQSQTYRFVFVSFYSIHPIMPAMVSWVPGRNDLILTLFLIISLWSVIKLFKSNKTIFLVLHLVFYAIAIFSKETALLIPVLTFVIYYTFKKTNWTYSLAHLWVLIKDFYSENKTLVYGWGIIFTFYFILRTMALSGNHFSFFSYIASILVSLPDLLILTRTVIAPINLQVFLDFNWMMVLYSIPAVLLLVGIIYKLKQTKANLVLGLSWFIIFLIPTLLSSLIMYHRMALPLIGMAFVFSSLDQKHFVQKFKIGAILLFFVFVFFGFGNYRFQKAFKSPINYWTNALEYSPNSALANNGMAWHYHIEHQLDSAYFYYSQVLKQDSTNTNTRIAMAIIAEEMGDENLTDSLLQEEFKVTLDSSNVYFYIGQILLERNDTNGAIENLQLGSSVMNYSRNARIYFDTLDVKVKSKLKLNK